MVHFKFKFHGENRGYKLFSLIDESGWNKYKIDEFDEVTRISHDDIDLVACNTTVSNNEETIDSKSDLITLEDTKEFFKTLSEKNVELKGLGKFNDNEYTFMQVHSLEVTLTNGKTVNCKYNAINKDNAVHIAKINNPLFESAEVKQVI